MTINAAWHGKNKMPKNATAAQRLAWHLAHAKHCGCRKLTKEFLAKLRAGVK
ncbi:MAG TPA: hypothetical protein VI875_04510 [Candidatus Norongarragalinales archaeon]|nr:hypothetical protein [Candidatus Norongarragalinales archaeon]